MPKKSKPAKRPHGGRAQIGGSPQDGGRAQAPIYKQKPPKGVASALRAEIEPQARPYNADLPNAHIIAAAPFELREDGSIGAPVSDPARSQAKLHRAGPEDGAPIRLTFSSDTPFVRLYHGNCLELLDAIAAKYPEGRFDAIFADPPYFLSNGGITCHAGKMVRVDKGDWDKSRGPELNHEFNLEWLVRCQRVLKPNGTIWVSGTQHIIFSIGYAMQQLGYKVLNDIAWEKPNPPPNLSCRYFTHSTETILWAAKNEKSKHVFNYQEMRKVTGKQMKTVWRANEFGSSEREFAHSSAGDNEDNQSRLTSAATDPIWTMTAPGGAEKEHGKHPTQKPVALIERCLLASTNAGDLVLDPFLGSGTTATAAIKLNRGCVAVEADLAYHSISAKRANKEIVLI